MTSILIIGYVWPEPDSSAAGSRMMQLIRVFLAQGWSVTFASAAAASSHMADIEALGVDRADIELNSSSFDEFVAQLKPDMVLFDRFIIEEQFGWRVAQQCPQALRILDTEDLHCLRAARQEALKAGREVTAQELNSELAMREVAAILRCDLSLIISEFEIDLLRRHYGVSANLLWHLPFMLPPVSQEDLTAYGDRQGYVSIGNFRHAPNWDAVLYLKNTLWPLIRKRQPDALLDVYGAYPPPKATQLNNAGQGFHVKGWADDAHGVMRQARVCLAPLRFGAGLKGKLADAMSCGTPNVTTSIGAEAMHAALPWSGIIADDPETFSRSAVALYGSEPQWRKAQENGVRIINTLYDKARLGEGLLARIADLRANLASHRLDNFAGAMLRHHTLQSTRYMAQWIEAKNRRKRDDV
jgi:hypothetical protein